MAKPLPEDFRDAAKRSLAAARKPFLDGESKRSLIERAKILMQLAVQTEQSIALFDSRPRPAPRLPDANDAALQKLKKRLLGLSPGMTHHMATAAYVGLFKNGSNGLDETWERTARLSQECDCEVEFRPGATVWFVKRPTSTASSPAPARGDPEDAR